MPYAVTSDEVKLYYEEVGQAPILFVHEFVGDHRSWGPQLHEFGRRYRCITYAARGYRPSDVPSDPAAYSYMHHARRGHRARSPADRPRAPHRLIHGG